MRKQSLIVILVLCFVFSLVGCSDTAGYSDYEETKAKTIKSGTVAENERFELNWDQSKKRVILYDKEMNVRWSSTPETELDNNPIESGVKTHPQVDSPIYVTYFDNVNFAEKIAYAATGAIKNGQVSAEQKDEVLSVTYDFENERFTVTVDYMLREDSLLVSVDTSKITEGEENTVTEVAIAPFFCSVKNNTDDSYLFVPSGSGAVIYSDVKLTQASNTAEKVYGYDYSVDSEGEFVNYEAVKLPVYGAINGNKGVCAIIEEGSEGANICTISNNTNMGYASVYTSFMTRGYDLINTPDGFYSLALKNKLYSDPIENQTYSVGFYPFYGEEASYVHMANIYRDYLEETSNFSEYESSANENAINLNIVGGAEYKNFFAGIPYKDFYATTTLGEARSIIDEARAIAGDVNVSLEGFTGSGVNVGEPAGGIGIHSSLGSYKELSDLYETYDGTQTSIFLNYDLVRFNKSGTGISTVFDSAVTTNGKQTSIKVKSQASGLPDDEQETYKLVSRNSLEDLNEKVLRKVLKKKVGGVGLSTVSNMAYADYTNEQCFVGLGMANQVSGLLKAYRENKILVMGNSANGYAAANCDYVTEVPTSSSNYESFDVDVPFYQIVYKGRVPMSVSAVNLAADKDTLLLKALESGVGLLFSVANNYDVELVNSLERNFYGMNMDNVMTEIKAISEAGYCDILNDLSGVTIEDHIIVNDSVRKTVYSNGLVIWVNYGDAVYSAQDITIEPNHYYVER